MDEQVGVALGDHAAAAALAVAPVALAARLLGRLHGDVGLEELLARGVGLGVGLLLGGQHLGGRALLEDGFDLVGRALGRELAVGDGGEHVVCRLEAQRLGHAGDRLDRARRGDAVASLAQLAGKLATARLGVVGLGVGREVLADLGARRRRDHDVHPVAARLGVLVGEDLDAVAGGERLGERDHAAVDLGAHAMVAHLGVHLVSEVERRGAGAQVHDLALGREDEDLVLEQVDAQVLEELVRVVHLALDRPVEAAADPRDLLVDALVVGAHVALGVARALVEPVGGDAVLGLLVHLEGADLDLDGARLGAHHGGVEALVAVGLGRGDVVLEAAGQRVPQGVDRAQGAVAVAHALQDDTQGDEVVDVGELLALALHLEVDAPQVLGAPGDLEAVEAHAAQLVGEGLDGLLGVALALVARVLHHAGDALVLLGLEVEEAQVLELPLDRRDAEAVCERRVDVHGLVRLEDAAVGRQGRQGAHVVQAVGQLDDDDADVAAHGEEHLAQVQRLLGVHRVDLDGGELGDAVDELGHRLAEQAHEVLERGGGVLHRVVQQRGADDVLVHVQVVRQDEGDLDGVVDVGLAAAALLVAVELGGEAVGLVDLGHLLGREVARAGLAKQRVVVGAHLGHAHRHRVHVACLLRRLRLSHPSHSPSSRTKAPKPGTMGLLMRPSSSAALAERTQSQNSWNISPERTPSR